MNEKNTGFPSESFAHLQENYTHLLPKVILHGPDFAAENIGLWADNQEADSTNTNYGPFHIKCFPPLIIDLAGKTPPQVKSEIEKATNGNITRSILILTHSAYDGLGTGTGSYTVKPICIQAAELHVQNDRNTRKDGAEWYIVHGSAYLGKEGIVAPLPIANPRRCDAYNTDHEGDGGFSINQSLGEMTLSTLHPGVFFSKPFEKDALGGGDCEDRKPSVPAGLEAAFGALHQDPNAVIGHLGALFLKANTFEGPIIDWLEDEMLFSTVNLVTAGAARWIDEEAFGSFTFRRRCMGMDYRNVYVTDVDLPSFQGNTDARQANLESSRFATLEFEIQSSPASS